MSWTETVPDYCALQTDQGCTSSVNGWSKAHLSTFPGGDAVVPNMLAGVHPALQMQDGSYVGSVFGTLLQTSDMVRFDSSGNVLGYASGYLPQMATADGNAVGVSYDSNSYAFTGGLIPGPAVTLDANLNAIGQTVLMTQSWRGESYVEGSVEDKAATPKCGASLQPLAGGSPSPNGNTGRAWCFILIWQNDFTWRTDAGQTFDITYKAAAMKAAALEAFKKAYSDFPVTVTVAEGTPGTGDNRATMGNRLTLYDPNASDLDGGDTPPLGTDSYVNYPVITSNAPIALNIRITDAQSAINALNNTGLVQAMGYGLGHTAAHEIAHQFLKLCCDMDNSPNVDPGAKGTYNAGRCGTSDYSCYYIDFWPNPPNPPIKLQWEAPTLLALHQCLDLGWRKFYGHACHN